MSLSFRSWLLAAALLPASLAGQAPADSLLNLLQQRATSGSAALTAARSALRTLEARVPEASARSAPTLNVEVDEVPGGAELWNAGNLQLSIEQELFTGRRRQLAAAVATTALERQRLEVTLLKRAITTALARDYARWNGARIIADRLQIEDELLQDLERGLNSRFAVGEARYVDVLRVRTERLQVQSEQAAVRQEVRRARVRLTALAGDTTDLASLFRAAELAPAIPALPTTAPPVDSLLAERSALGAFSFRHSEARAIADRERAARGPRMTAGAGIQRFGTPGDFSVGPALRLSVALPFAVTNSNRQIAAAGIAGEAQGAAEDAALLQHARMELTVAHQRFVATREQLELFDSALLLGSRSERDAALASYRTGSLSLIELLDFERALSRAEIAHVRALLDAHDAWADLLSPTGSEGADHD